MVEVEKLSVPCHCVGYCLDYPLCMCLKSTINDCIRKTILSGDCWPILLRKYQYMLLYFYMIAVRRL